MAAGDYSRVEADALAQVEAGAHMLDVNAGIPLADEPAILAESIRIVQSITDVPISIDSSIVAALKRGLETYEGKPLVNSVTAEEERLETVLPLVKKYDAAVIGISNDETGISEDPDVRFAVARRIVERAMDHGIPKENVIIDPLVMPIGAMGNAGQQVFHIVRRCRQELGVNTCCGASNISFGLPNRAPLNGAFLSMVIAAGMTSAITNPLESEIRQSIMAADVMMGHDENCMVWIGANRPDEAEESQTGRRRRQGRRRRER
jgi:5-methyltetrahydrofolate--homocysteine methyltransferase